LWRSGEILRTSRRGKIWGGELETGRNEKDDHKPPERAHGRGGRSLKSWERSARKEMLWIPCDVPFLAESREDLRNELEKRNPKRRRFGSSKWEKGAPANPFGGKSEPGVKRG